MVPDADKKGLSLTTSLDPRITRIGRFLRKYKIDELPQLYHITVVENCIIQIKRKY